MAHSKTHTDKVNIANQMVICNRCENGYPVSNQFVGSCPKGWTTDKNPCKDTDKTPNNKNNISLSKTVYGKTNAKKALDEEFTEFLPQTKNYKEFFDLYDSFFYDIPKPTHESFMYESNNYLDYPYSAGNGKIVEELEEQLANLQQQIDSIERHHPFIPNGSVLADNSNKPNSNTPMSGDRYLLQSNRKRLISGNEIYKLLKTRLKVTKPDSEFIIFIPDGGLDEITDGPPITTPDEIFVGIEIINSYYG